MPIPRPFLTFLALCTTLPCALSFLPASSEIRLTPLADIAGGPRQEHTVVYVEPDTIALIGGVVPDANAILAPFSSTDRVELYSIASNTWRTVAPMPKPLNHPNAAAVEGKIYVLGGFDDGGTDREYLRATNESWVYDPAIDIWSPIEPFPNAQGMATVEVWGSKIYVVGGFKELYLPKQMPLPRTSDAVSIYDTMTRKWTTDSLPEKAKHIPGGRDHVRSAIVESKMYIIGGFHYGGYSQTDTIFILDLKQPEAGWVTSPAKMPTPRASAAVAAQGKLIYVIGGEGNATSDAMFPTRVFDDVEVYDTVTDSWTRLEPISYARHGGGVGAGGKLYIPGGADRQPVGPIARFDAYIMDKKLQGGKQWDRQEL
ncbi:hypothetical protein IFR05_014083 [Cadophora sp. M221]|nr:hypothetical protein IFR05_014083 [Cadophora sp. M221]